MIEKGQGVPEIGVHVIVSIIELRSGSIGTTSRRDAHTIIMKRIETIIEVEGVEAEVIPEIEIEDITVEVTFTILLLKNITHREAVAEKKLKSPSVAIR